MSDLISRQAAIDAICNACGKIDCDKMDKCEKLQLPPANCSEFPNNSDTISRQAAIDTLHMDTSIIPYKKAREYADATILEIRNRLEKLPSVQPESKREWYMKGYRDAQPQRWIPVTERLPEEDGQYLITVKYKHVDGYDDIYAEHGEWYDGKWDMFCFGHCGKVEGITAWMPLPEPYAERKEDE